MKPGFASTQRDLNARCFLAKRRESLKSSVMYILFRPMIMVGDAAVKLISVGIMETSSYRGLVA